MGQVRDTYGEAKGMLFDFNTLSFIFFHRGIFFLYETFSYLHFLQRRIQGIQISGKDNVPSKRSLMGQRKAVHLTDHEYSIAQRV